MPASRAAASAAETPRAMSTPDTSPAKPGWAGSMGRMITELGMIGDIGVSPAGGAGPPRFCGNYSPGRAACHGDGPLTLPRTRARGLRNTAEKPRRGLACRGAATTCRLMTPMFRDRRDAGRQLAAKLNPYAGTPDLIVLALPRGRV